MFEIGSGELRATFLGNHTGDASCTRRPTQQHKGHHTPNEALHPLRGTAPLTGRCTRYGPLHPNRRGVMPTDRVQRTQSQEQTRNLRDDRRHAQGPGSSRRGPQHSAATSQHSTIGDPSSPITNHRSAANGPSTITNRRSVNTPRHAVATVRDGDTGGG